MKYVLIYEDVSHSINHRFFETDSEDKIPFVVGNMNLFYDCDPMAELNRKEKKFLKTLDIDLEPEESFMILEIPETMKKF